MNRTRISLLVCDLDNKYQAGGDHNHNNRGAKNGVDYLRYDHQYCEYDADSEDNDGDGGDDFNWRRIEEFI